MSGHIPPEPPPHDRADGSQFPVLPQPGTAHGEHSSGANIPRPPLPTPISQDGRLPWAFGLLSAIGLPFVSLLAPGITMVIVGLRQRRKNPVAAHIGRNAAIFGAVNIVVVVVFLLVLAISSAVYGGGVSFDESPVLIAGFAIPVGAYIVVIGPGLNLILAIVALLRPIGPEKVRKILDRLQTR